ncbi:MAG: carbamoyltransferase [Promethearchaeota archaeon]
MPVILGIHDSAFDSGATIIKDDDIIASLHEERLCRIKHSGAFPFLSIKEVLKISNIDPSEIEKVAIGFENPNAALQFFQYYFNSSSKLNPLKSKWDYVKLTTFEKYEEQLKNNTIKKLNKSVSNLIQNHLLRKLGINSQIIRIDHHLCHAASAYFSSGYNKCLVITADARGDGISTSINIANNGLIERIASSDEKTSMGHFYGGVTEILGFGYADGEGKTEALAAFGKQSNAYDKLKSYARVEKLLLKGNINTKKRLLSIYYSNLLYGYQREDIAYAAQKILEEIFVNLIQNAIDETGISDIALAGGIFLNVKLNKKIMEIPDLKDVFIHPAAGDSGISTGAAFILYSELYGLKSNRWKHVYLGNSSSDEEIKKSLKKTDLKYEYIDNISEYVGEQILPKDKLIGWFQDRMEYGPRALGCRSVLIDPRNPKSPSMVNTKFKHRPAFQPYCPSILREEESHYINNPKKIDASFMIMAFNTKPDMIKEAPAVVFTDHTSRIQVVDKKYNKKFYDLLEYFYKETKVPILLNTSFNRAGEPIVCKPEEAINDFIITNLDYLVMGNYLITK